ncbi:hypothetical protein IW262DRAFT_177390 [Armillaria fumosa]|nr:hypothetical protein IW262DRAFT_177390 [Armillaria fumosa]
MSEDEYIVSADSGLVNMLSSTSTMVAYYVGSYLGQHHTHYPLLTHVNFCCFYNNLSIPHALMLLMSKFSRVSAYKPYMRLPVPRIRNPSLTSTHTLGCFTTVIESAFATISHMILIWLSGRHHPTFGKQVLLFKYAEAATPLLLPVISACFSCCFPFRKF